MITPAQCLEARKLLKWSRDRLAARSEMPAERLRFFEIGSRNLSPEDLAAIQRTLEAEGVVVLAEGGAVDGGPGVLLKKAKAE